MKSACSIFEPHFSYIHRVLNKFYPLVKSPLFAGATYSDLFIWRNDKNWRTFFRLVDISALFSDTDQYSSSALLIINSMEGKELRRIELNLSKHDFELLDLSCFLNDINDSLGTFCIFHDYTPSSLTDLGCSLTERGYVAYSYKGEPLLAYVHGNFDAVSRDRSDQIIYQMSSLPIERNFQIQYCIDSQYQTEIIFTNPTPVNQSVAVYGISGSGEINIVASFDIRKGGAFLFLPPSSESLLLYIKSKMALSRPLIFEFEEESLNVFHS